MNYTEISENIKHQRYLKKLTQEELANISGIALPTIKKIEGGKSGIRNSTIEAIATALGVDMDTLMQPARRLKTIHFRTCRNMRSRESVISDIINKLEQYNRLEALTKDRLEPLYKKIDGKDPISAAKQARKLITMDDISPVADVTAALTAFGIKLLGVSVNTEKFFSLSVGEIDGGPAVIVNSNRLITYEQAVFSAVHEFGHLILHKNSGKSVTDEIVWAEEDEADLFASHFLLPEKGLEYFWNASAGLPWAERIIKVKHIFGISYKTLIARLGDFKALNKRFESEYNNIKERRDPEPLNKELRPEIRLHWLAAKAAANKLIPKEEAAAIIAIKDSEIDSYLKSLD